MRLDLTTPDGSMRSTKVESIEDGGSASVLFDAVPAGEGTLTITLYTLYPVGARHPERIVTEVPVAIAKGEAKHLELGRSEWELAGPRVGVS